ncbi:hypothetical protein HDG40_002762 [Paraburkholderia sp. JPY158]|uniref:Uncharacterized protein n=1 Tax=Paraburkholderia atlantica TaxID=2654982 RepID=A0A7W8V690_PARAM|nr:hypothetical protein [Paraburkholderia atlantica]MBB5424617.1 hypothetical protein [Paraburkholderia atlantica]
MNRRYFNAAPASARPHKNDFFIGMGCFFRAACVYDGDKVCWDANARGEAVRHDSCGSGGAMQQRRIIVNPALSYAIKDRRAARESREWSHEDAAFLAILFQANFYVLPEKA